jgi:hypothetical protein
MIPDALAAMMKTAIVIDLSPADRAFNANHDPFTGSTYYLLARN